MPCSDEPCHENRPHPVGVESGAQAWPSLARSTSQAFELRYQQRYALHPVEAALQYHRASAEISGEVGHGGCGFEEAEAHYRAGAQGLRLSEIPQLPQQLRELSRLSSVDRAGRRALRKWAQEQGLDSKAVILIGMPPHKDLATEYDHYTWFMAASRARQLLAVIEST